MWHKFLSKVFDSFSCPWNFGSIWWWGRSISQPKSYVASSNGDIKENINAVVIALRQRRRPSPSWAWGMSQTLLKLYWQLVTITVSIRLITSIPDICLSIIKQRCWGKTIRCLVHSYWIPLLTVTKAKALSVKQADEWCWCWLSTDAMQWESHGDCPSFWRLSPSQAISKFCIRNSSRSFNKL